MLWAARRWLLPRLMRHASRIEHTGKPESLFACVSFVPDVWDIVLPLQTHMTMKDIIGDDVTSPCVVDVVQVLGCGSEDSSNPPQTHATRSTIDFQLRRFFAFSHHEWFVAHFRILWSEIDLLLSMYCEHGVRAYSSSVYTCIHVSRLNCWHLAPVLL